MHTEEFTFTRFFCKKAELLVSFNTLCKEIRNQGEFKWAFMRDVQANKSCIQEIVVEKIYLW